MPNNLTLLDLAKLNSADMAVGLIEEVLTVAPETTIIPARTIPGTSYKISSRTGRPSVSFRALNEGTDAVKSNFTERTIEAFLLSARVEVDKAAANAYIDGAVAYQALEARGVMAEALYKVGQQTIYGTAQDGKGFPGLQSLVTTLGSVVVDGGETSGNACSSVYAIAAGSQGVQYVYGQNTTIDLSAFREGDAADSNNKRFAAYIADLTAWVGLQCANKFAVGRIKNLGTGAGKTLTDAKLLDLLRQFPVGVKPTHFLMSRRSAYQLAISRSITANTKQEAFSGLLNGLPTESFGIPIIVTDSINDTEAFA
jgi:hypothetical protein